MLNFQTPTVPRVVFAYHLEEINGTVLIYIPFCLTVTFPNGQISSFSEYQVSVIAVVLHITTVMHLVEESFFVRFWPFNFGPYIGSFLIYYSLLQTLQNVHFCHFSNIRCFFRTVFAATTSKRRSHLVFGSVRPLVKHHTTGTPSLALLLIH